MTYSEERRAKMRERMMGSKNPMFGIHLKLSDIRKAKLREQNTGEKNPFFGRHHTEETKAKLRRERKGEAKAQTGRARAEKMYACPDGNERHHIDGNPLNNSPENVVFVTRKEHLVLDGRLSRLHMGRLCSEETKTKIREANLGKRRSEETKARMREAKMGKRNPMYGKHYRKFWK